VIVELLQIYYLNYFSFLDISSDQQTLESLISMQLKTCDAGFVCLLCLTTIKRKHHARRHMSEKHMPPRQYHCPPCGKVFNNRTFSHHMNTVHPMLKGMDYETFLVNNM
jgi:uncharacterized Zn-finger protein